MPGRLFRPQRRVGKSSQRLQPLPRHDRQRLLAFLSGGFGWIAKQAGLGKLGVARIAREQAGFITRIIFSPARAVIRHGFIHPHQIWLQIEIDRSFDLIGMAAGFLLLQRIGRGRLQIIPRNQRIISSLFLPHLTSKTVRKLEFSGL